VAIAPILSVVVTLQRSAQRWMKLPSHSGTAGILYVVRARGRYKAKEFDRRGESIDGSDALYGWGTRACRRGIEAWRYRALRAHRRGGLGSFSQSPRASAGNVLQRKRETKRPRCNRINSPNLAGTSWRISGIAQRHCSTDTPLITRQFQRRRAHSRGWPGTLGFDQDDDNRNGARRAVVRLGERGGRL